MIGVAIVILIGVYLYFVVVVCYIVCILVCVCLCVKECVCVFLCSPSIYIYIHFCTIWKHVWLFYNAYNFFCLFVCTLLYDGGFFLCFFFLLCWMEFFSSINKIIDLFPFQTIVPHQHCSFSSDTFYADIIEWNQNFNTQTFTTDLSGIITVLNLNA